MRQTGSVPAPIEYDQEPWKTTGGPTPNANSDLPGEDSVARRAFARWALPSAAWSSAVIVGYVLAAFAVSQLFLSRRFSPDLSFYVLQPLLWSGLAVLSFRLWLRLDERPAFSPLVLSLGLLAGLFQVALLLIAGVLLGLGHSPYARQPLHIAENLWYLATLLAGLELARGYLVAVWSRARPAAGFLLVALLFTLVSLSTSQLQFLLEGNRRFETVGQALLPGFAENVLATSFAVIGGPLAALIYRGTLAGFEWVSPVLPNLPWPATAAFGTLAPALALVFVRNALDHWQQEEEDAAAPVSEKGPSLLWAVAVVAVVVTVWLNTGLLGVRTALISGPSMEPYLTAGDVVVTKTVSPSSLKVGDVIRFRYGGSDVMHRIVAIQKSGTSLAFITQGDANDVVDEPVLAQQITGRLVVKLPKVGWLPIGVHEALERLGGLL